MGREQLIREAEAAEQLAKMISFHPDKERLLGLAARLRDEAATIEVRSWPEAAPPPLHAPKPQRPDH
ncbi:hypothetical protein LJR225_002213 [Phenylobacterium sp. LjRoot225]|uniref:hypothetical protein n=1 Tax=Phenylobacterium sp. LjRoot225 TaxID=3342285 RepID=UPI003ECEE2C6